MKRRALAFVCSIAATAFAQTPFEIRGTVSEPGLGGIAGAEVQAILRGPNSERPIVSSFTDGRGQFVLRTTTPGSYLLIPRLEGYAIELQGSAARMLDADHPRADVQLSMIRPGQVLGRVLDAETREPIEGIMVSVVGKNSGAWLGALPIADSLETLKRRVEEGKTGADGTFAISGLRPGEYAVTLARTSGSPWTAGYSAEDLKGDGQGYADLFWPGGVPADAVRPLALGSGAVVSFGDMLLKKVPNYRVHVSLAQGSCPPGESMRVSLFRAGKRDLQVAPCGSELLLRGLAPGSYYLYAVSDWQGERDNIENAAWATTQFEISSKNVEVELVPRQGVILEGQLVAVDSATALPERLALGMRPDELAPGIQPDEEDFIEWLPAGKFRMAASPRTQTLFRSTSSGRDTPYVKEVRYNGSPLPDLKVPVNPGSSAHHLDLVLGEKLGSLSGTITGATPQTGVFLWTEGMLFPLALYAENGSFHSEPLIPGEYRVSTMAAQTTAGMAVNMDRVKAGEKVTIRPGETTTINVPTTGASK